MATPAGSVAASSRPVLTIRTKPRSTSAMTFNYDDKTGTLAASHYFKALAEKGETKYIVLNGQGTIDSIKETLIKELGLN